MFGRPLQNTYLCSNDNEKSVFGFNNSNAATGGLFGRLQENCGIENNNNNNNPTSSSRSLVAVSNDAKANNIASTMTRVTFTKPRNQQKAIQNQSISKEKYQNVRYGRTNSKLPISMTQAQVVAAQPVFIVKQPSTSSSTSSLNTNTTGKAVEAATSSADKCARAPPLETFEFFVTKQFSGWAEQKSVQTTQLRAMIERSRKDRLKANSNWYKTLQTSQVEQIQFFCQALSTNQATTFRALELYDRFVVSFNVEMYMKTRNMVMTEKESVRERIIAQGPLRICSCILLASKLHSDNTTPIITTRKLNALLVKCGYNYTGKTIARSEIRVISILNFRLHWVTPFDLVEQMISLLDISNANVRKVYHHAMLLVEFCYLTHHEIYMKFWEFRCQQSNHSSSDEKERKTFKFTIEFNVPLRSASIVASAIFLTIPPASERITQELASVTAISEKDINDLSLLILDFLIL